ncbi:uncharacterized protein LOC124544576 [Zea mays]|uniref:uncharacterized protein LOC124544576 n=1 Tax=Zea mays TaxID=4577 RepID=UPI001F502D4D|nr:uncharacterized protein LOC124544576 [Zea mays]
MAVFFPLSANTSSGDFFSALLLSDAGYFPQVACGLIFFSVIVLIRAAPLQANIFTAAGVIGLIFYPLPRAWQQLVVELLQPDFFHLSLSSHLLVLKLWPHAACSHGCSLAEALSLRVSSSLLDPWSSAFPWCRCSPSSRPAPAPPSRLAARPHGMDLLAVSPGAGHFYSLLLLGTPARLPPCVRDPRHGAPS